VLRIIQSFAGKKPELNVSVVEAGCHQGKYVRNFSSRFFHLIPTAPLATVPATIPMSKEALILAKQRWAEKQSLRGEGRGTDQPSTERLPPGQRLTTGFPVLDLGIQPDLPLNRWSLTLNGEVEFPQELTWPDVQALPQVQDISDFHCVTTWSKFDCRWSGVAFTTLYELVQPSSSVGFVYFTGYDGYSTNVPLTTLLDDDVLLATSFEGKPITKEHGGPARIIVPKLYAWKGAKFVKSIQFRTEDKLGFWELRGYSNTADPFKEERFS
jgi:DMSO/TMAO reductase YedYZ molybdopterin-dependent catalytic subunit